MAALEACLCCGPGCKKEMSIEQKLTARLLTKLEPYQLEAIDFSIKNQGRVYLADDMGLGKTVQAIAIAFCYETEWPLLVICPASLIEQWQKQIVYWLHPQIIKTDIGIVHGKTTANLEGKKIYLTSYSSVQLLEKHKLPLCEVVIIDECHYLKNGKQVQRFRSVLKFISSAVRLVLLSATPITTQGMDNLVNQYKLFNVVLDKSELNKPSNLVQRFKDELSAMKVVKNRHLLEIQLDSDDRAELKRLEVQMNFITWSIECARRKVKQFVAVNKPWLLKFRKLICFYKHDSVAQTFEAEFETPYCSRISGKTSLGLRKSLLNAFENSAAIHIMLIQIQIGGTGLDLNFVSDTLFLELDFNPTTLLQAEDRTYRKGQRSDCDAFYLINSDDGMPDSRMLAVISSKLTFLKKTCFINEAQASLNSLNKL
ncbi:SWI/SNF-related matrix-associated actin-dependent regulator of chromatin subfamily A-like protein 1 [Halotydeus destructor]|nr:SWI/SNF-related matrix-associated actin-dependent regulator of chromatin subfamily A-like protein 1 [Halotydeus destructor]